MMRMTPLAIDALPALDRWNSTLQITAEDKPHATWRKLDT